MKKILCTMLALCITFSCFMLTSCEEESQTVTSKLEIVGLSCGQADSFVMFTDNKTIVIDCGESDDSKKITKLLQSRGIDTIDYMILSHYDQDHIGGAEKVFSKIKVNKIYETFIPKSNNEVYDSFVAAVNQYQINAIQVLSTTSLNIDGIEFTIYPPQKKNYDIDESNNSSLCVTMTYGECSFMFAGDAQDARLAELTADNLGTFDFLKFPYHGYFQENLPAFLEMVQPKYSVITCSDKNPADAASINELKKYGTEIYLTQTSDVTVICDGKTITCEQQDAPVVDNTSQVTSE